MAKQRWGEDFEPWKPHGNVGDFKCDGYHIPKKTVYQSHGPEKPNASRTSSKIWQDFEGAKLEFKERMSKWVFVYNQPELPAPCGKLLDDLRVTNPEIEIRAWVRQDLLAFASELKSDGLALIFPELFGDIDLGREVREAFRELMNEREATIMLSVANNNQNNQNRPALNQALDDLAGLDREIRTRLLAYSKWLDPLLIERSIQILEERGFNPAAVRNNIGRLGDLGYVTVTNSHILPLNDNVCSEAANELSDEFIEILGLD